MSGLEVFSFQAERHALLVEPLTELLHRCYRPLAEKGMRYLATHQSPQDRHVGFAQWKETNYRSVILSKALTGHA